MTRIWLLTGLGLAALAVLVVWWAGPVHLQGTVAPAAAEQAVSTPAAPDIFASPVHGGCYIAGPSDCRIHVEPFTINIASGQKLALFRLVAIQMPSNIQTVLYDWRPDLSNPVPPSGTTYTPSLVAQDFAATCGKSYEISLQGRDTGDTNTFNLGLTGQFTCTLSLP
ncbi:MAG: hypothetical protein U0559_07280 [Anaerolineae bacterium]